jgi:hypothetical protein
LNGIWKPRESALGANFPDNARGAPWVPAARQDFAAAALARLASNALLCRNQMALKRFRVGGCCHRISLVSRIDLSPGRIDKL